MNRALVLVALVGAVGLAGSARAINLVANGDFETVATGGANGSGVNYWTFNNGNASIASWTVGGVSVDIVTGSAPHFGTYALDVVGSPGPGSVSQTLATVAGLTHVVTFKAFWMGAVANRTIEVSLGGAMQTVVLGGAGSWQDVSLNFVGVVGSSNLFKLASLSTNTTNGNTFIDNVNVSPVPEPFTLGLAGLGLAAAWRRRR